MPETAIQFAKRLLDGPDFEDIPDCIIHDAERVLANSIEAREAELFQEIRVLKDRIAMAIKELEG